MAITALQVNGYSGAFQNYYDSAADYGPAGYDATHNLSFTSVYALPAGRGQKYFTNANRAVDEIIGGWKVSAVGVVWSGFPETITAPGNNSNSYGVSRANQYMKLKIVNRKIFPTATNPNGNWFGTDPSALPCTQPGSRINALGAACAFGVPAPNTFGSSRNGAVRGPGYANVDLSAFKDFQTYKQQTIGFRFDAFNAFNIVSYGNPDTGVTDSGFGEIALQGSIRSVERHLQFSLRYTF